MVYLQGSGNGDYLELKDQLFPGETVNSFSEKLKLFIPEKLAYSEVNNK
ncbi:hypothetical protein [Okeania sp. SIO1I7]|nr:hypothetical protein [Okeania sp. SIO1I7]NET29971.1 hypothetical protein [Okeania sp. SIO1I7]